MPVEGGSGHPSKHTCERTSRAGVPAPSPPTLVLLPDSGEFKVLDLAERRSDLPRAWGDDVSYVWKRGRPSFDADHLRRLRVRVVDPVDRELDRSTHRSSPPRDPGGTPTSVPEPSRSTRPFRGSPTPATGVSSVRKESRCRSTPGLTVLVMWVVRCPCPFLDLRPEPPVRARADQHSRPPTSRSGSRRREWVRKLGGKATS